MIISNNLKKLSKIFHKTSPLYIVGGYVRDFLLSINTIDVDICSKLGTNEVVNLLKNTEFTTNVVNKKLGTIIITVDNEKYEYTPFRVDNYLLDGTHSPSCIRFNVGLKDDFLRRDFTINALYYDIEADRIIDNASCVDDIQNGLIRTIREPEITFTEDALRLFRMVRFSVVLGMKIDENTLFAGRKHAYLIKNLSNERVVDEFNKVIAKVDYSQMLDYVDLLFDSGIIQNLFYVDAKISNYKIVEGLEVYSPTIEFLYLCIFERYFYYKLDFVTGVKLDCFNDIVDVERKIYLVLDELLDLFKLPNKTKRNIYELICFTRLLVEVKSKMELDILLTHYYNIINSLLVTIQSRIMVKNTIFVDVVSRFLTLVNTKPIKVTDLAISGKQLQELGVEKRCTNDVLTRLLEMVITDKISNNYSSLASCVKEDKWIIQ